MRQALIAGAVATAVGLAPAPASAQGTPYDFGCQPGYAVVGLQGWQGWWMDGIRAICARIDPATGTVTTATHTTSLAGRSTGAMQTRRCPAGTVLTGFTGNRAAYVLSVHSIRCTPLRQGGVAENGGQFHDAFPKKSPPPGQQGYFLAHDCSSGQVVRRIRGRAGVYVDYFSVTCEWLSDEAREIATAPTPASSAPIVRRTGSFTPTRAAPPATPVLVSPANGHQVVGRPADAGCYTGLTGFPTFRWNAVTGAARYVLEIENVTTGRRMARASTTTSTGLSVGTARYTPRAGSTYRWRVRAVNAIGMEGPWSAYRSFTATSGTRTDGPCVAATPTSVVW